MFGSLKNTRYMQYVASLAAAMSIASGAMFTSWGSTSLPKLQSPDTPLNEPLTSDEASWISSVFLVSPLLICVFIPTCMDKFGRKKMLLLSAFFYVVGWIMVIFVKTFFLLLLARIIAGFGLGIATIGAAMYNGEIADNDIRGKLGTSFNTMKLVGSFMVLSIAPFVSYLAIAIIASIFPILFFAIFFFMPESPYHLINVGKKDEARAALMRFAPGNVEKGVIDKKLCDIECVIENDMRNKLGLKEFLTKKEYRMSIIIMAGVKTLQQMSGTIVMEQYLATIIGSSKSDISPEISSIIFGAVQFPAAFLAAAVVDKLGRKPILLISSCGCTICLLAEGVYFFLQKETDVDIDLINWLPTTALVFFQVMATFGILGLPYVLLGELFPSNIKSIAVTVISNYGALLAFTASKIFNPVVEAWGIYTIFWIYAGFCLSGLIFVFLMLPETKGKSFMEIQAKLNRKYAKKDLEAVVDDVKK